MIRALVLLLFFAFPAAAQTFSCQRVVSAGGFSLACAETVVGVPVPVQPPPPPPPSPASTPTGCAPANVNGSFPYAGAVINFFLSSAQTASYRLAVATAGGGGNAEILAFQSTLTPSDLQTVVAIADCPGKFDVAPECKQSGSAWSSIDLHAFAAPAPFAGYCTLDRGKQYYVNVRNDCKQDSCEQRIQYFGNLR